MKKLPKYTWVGNRISPEHMSRLYRLKVITGKPITVLVARAISMYLDRQTEATK